MNHPSKFGRVALMIGLCLLPLLVLAPILAREVPLSPWIFPLIFVFCWPAVPPFQVAKGSALLLAAWVGSRSQSGRFNSNMEDQHDEPD